MNLIEAAISYDDTFFTKWFLTKSPVEMTVHTESGPLLPPNLECVEFTEKLIDGLGYFFEEYGEFYTLDDVETPLTFNEFIAATGWNYAGPWGMSPVTEDFFSRFVDSKAADSNLLDEFDAAENAAIDACGGFDQYRTEAEAKVGKKFVVYDYEFNDRDERVEFVRERYTFTPEMIPGECRKLFWQRHYSEVAAIVAAAIPQNPYAVKYVRSVEIAQQAKQEKFAASKDSEWNQKNADKFPGVLAINGGLKFYSTSLGVDINEPLVVVEAALNALLARNAAKEAEKALKKTAEKAAWAQAVQSHAQRLEPLKQAAEKAGFTVVVTEHARTLVDAVYVRGTYNMKCGRVEDPDLEWFCKEKQIYSKKPIKRSK